MKCHICGKEMRVINVETVEQNDTVINTIETWWCDDCDGLWNTVRRMLKRIFS